MNPDEETYLTSYLNALDPDVFQPNGIDLGLKDLQSNVFCLFSETFPNHIFSFPLSQLGSPLILL